MELLEKDLYQIKNAIFWLPNYPEDCIQGCIVGLKDYWDRKALDIIDKYLEDNATILDIGANIGSHSLYWALERHAKKIYSFEPFDSTYEVLEKNVILNDLENIITTFNTGLSDVETKTSVKMFFPQNIGSTAFTKNENGNFTFVPLDSFNFSEKIDLIKIDVEGAELEVLNGGFETISKHKPVIVIETFTNKEGVDTILASHGYSHVDTIREGEDYIYKII